MRTYTEITSVQKYLVSIVCDICNQRYGGHWDPDRFETLETTVEFARGFVYPEGGSVTSQSLDVCPTCFENKVVPAVEALGCTFRTKKKDIG